MRQFYDWDGITQNTHVGFSVPGFMMAANAGEYCAFTQAEPVLRVSCWDSSAEWLQVIVEGQSGYVVADPVEYTARCPYGRTVYVPMSGLLRTLYSRTFTGVSASGTDMLAAGEVTLRLLDSGFASIGAYTFIVRFYDSVGADMHGVEAPFPGLPERLVCLAGATNFLAVPKVSVSGTGGEVTMYSGTSLVRTVAYDGDGGTLGFSLQASSQPVTTVTVGNSRPHVVRVEWLTCAADRLLLTWWSPVAGGWKSRPAEVLGYSAETVSRKEVLRGFGRTDIVETDSLLAVRFPLLSAADYLYCRDVLESDEVYATRKVATDTRGGAETLRLPVRVSGSVPRRDIIGFGNIDFSVNYLKVKSL